MKIYPDKSTPYCKKVCNTAILTTQNQGGNLTAANYSTKTTTSNGITTQDM